MCAKGLAVSSNRKRTSGFIPSWYYSYTVSCKQRRGAAYCQKSVDKMGDLFLLLLTMYLNSLSNCHLSSTNGCPAERGWDELAQPTLSFPSDNRPSPTALLQVLPREASMDPHGSWVSPAVCGHICCTDFPKHCRFEWLLPCSLSFGELKHFIFSLREIPTRAPCMSSRTGAFCLNMPRAFGRTSSGS